MSIIIGIDPGSHRTGWGLVQVLPNQGLKCIGHGVIELSPKYSVQERLGYIHSELNLVITQFHPTQMALEKVFFGKNADSAFKLGQARGVVLAVAGQNNLAVFEYATRSIKKMVAGRGSAEKEQVQFMVENILNIQIKSLDASDALALAIGHSRELEIKSKLSQFHSYVNEGEIR